MRRHRILKMSRGYTISPYFLADPNQKTLSEIIEGFVAESPEFVYNPEESKRVANTLDLKDREVVLVFTDSNRSHSSWLVRTSDGWDAIDANLKTTITKFVDPFAFDFLVTEYRRHVCLVTLLSPNGKAFGHVEFLELNGVWTRKGTSLAF